MCLSWPHPICSYSKSLSLRGQQKAIQAISRIALSPWSLPLFFLRQDLRDFFSVSSSSDNLACNAGYTAWPAGMPQHSTWTILFFPTPLLFLSLPLLPNVTREVPREFTMAIVGAECLVALVYDFVNTVQPHSPLDYLGHNFPPWCDGCPIKYHLYELPSLWRPWAVCKGPIFCAAFHQKRNVLNAQLRLESLLQTGMTVIKVF